MERRKSQVTRLEKFACQVMDALYISGVAALWVLVWYIAGTSL